MCLGTTGRVVGFLDEEHMAMVEFEGVIRQVSTAMLDARGEPVGVGDWVHVHLGLVLETVDEEHAREAIEFQRSLEEGVFPPTGRG